MAPRLKVVMASESKKGTQIYFSFLSKVLANESPPGSQVPVKREAYLQGILHISYTSSFGFPSKGALPKGPLHGIPRREMPHHYSPTSFICQSPRYMRPRPPHTRFPLDKSGPHGERCPYSETFLTYLPRSPVKELPFEAPSTDPLQREMFHPQSSLHPFLKVPCRQALLQVPQTGSLWKEMPISRAFSTYPSGSPAREPSLQVPFTELPQRETLLPQSPFQPYQSPR
jgi:hypothetical protein